MWLSMVGLCACNWKVAESNSKVGNWGQCWENHLTSSCFMGAGWPYAVTPKTCSYLYECLCGSWRAKWDRWKNLFSMEINEISLFCSIVAVHTAILSRGHSSAHRFICSYSCITVPEFATNTVLCNPAASATHEQVFKPDYKVWRQIQYLRHSVNGSSK